MAIRRGGAGYFRGAGVRSARAMGGRINRPTSLSSRFFLAATQCPCTRCALCFCARALAPSAWGQNQFEVVPTCARGSNRTRTPQRCIAQALPTFALSALARKSSEIRPIPGGLLARGCGRHCRRDALLLAHAIPWAGLLRWDDQGRRRDAASVTSSRRFDCRHEFRDPVT